MNTEQLKTKEEILDKYANEIGNYKDFRGILVAYKLCMDDPNRIDWVVDKAMQDFAQQEIQRDRESRWISVKDRLPEPKEQVLVYQPPKKWSHKDEMTKGRVLIGYMFRLPQDERGTWIDLNELNDKACSLRQGGLFWAFPYICHQNFVSHWQPLPEPPKL